MFGRGKKDWRDDDTKFSNYDPDVNYKKELGKKMLFKMWCKGCKKMFIPLTNMRETTFTLKKPFMCPVARKEYEEAGVLDYVLGHYKLEPHSEEGIKAVKIFDGHAVIHYKTYMESKAHVDELKGHAEKQQKMYDSGGYVRYITEYGGTKLHTRKAGNGSYAYTTKSPPKPGLVFPGNSRFDFSNHPFEQGVIYKLNDPEFYEYLGNMRVFEIIPPGMVSEGKAERHYEFKKLSEFRK